MPGIPNFIFGKTKIPLLYKSMDAYSMRQRSIVNNIANVSTPGFRRTEVKFEEELKKALGKRGIKGYLTNPKHIPVGRPSIERVKPIPYMPKDDSLRSGLNNVDIDHEMAELAKNQIRYAYATRLMRDSFNKLRSSIRGEYVR
ncbi:flagellar basal body rod protein FlgB [candidate division KSB1 bacterium]|nr:MAG: flagellar basal body rod protein FlgB [candidate division KSB1 bacterium]